LTFHRYIDLYLCFVSPQKLIRIVNTQATSKVVVGSTVVIIAAGGMKEAMGVSHTLMEATNGEEKVVTTAPQAGT
jgi:hypothetical protein